MKKAPLVVSLLMAGLLATACGGSSIDDQPAPTTTANIESPSDEGELKGALDRSGVGKGADAFYQSVDEILTFMVGTNCEGELWKTPDGTKYLLKISTKADNGLVFSTDFAAGAKGVLTGPDQKAVTDNCGK